jgi:hypothetical protein
MVARSYARDTETGEGGEMTTKQEILDFHCDRCVHDDGETCKNRNENKCIIKEKLSTILDSYRASVVAETVGDVPCEKVTFEDMASLKQRQVFMRYGWNNHCDKVEAWKQVKIKEAR